MKIWTEWTLPYWEEKPKWMIFAVDFYRHSPHHKWKGWTLQIVLFNRMLIVNYANPYAEYDKRMNRPYRSRK